MVLANPTLDIIFGVDMVLQFFVAFQMGSTFGGYNWVTDHGTIIKHYLTTWFIVDAATVFVPAAVDWYTAGLPPSHSTSSTSADVSIERIRIMRVLRVLRLFKLVRLIRASRLFQRWKAKITLSYGAQTMIQCVFLLLVAAHWYACVIGLTVSLMDGNGKDTWLQHWSLCRSTGPGPILESCDIELGDFYASALSWSFMVITGTGGTDPYPSENTEETIVVTVLNLIGALLWTMVLASFCDIATNGDPSQTSSASSSTASTPSSTSTTSRRPSRAACARTSSSRRRRSCARRSRGARCQTSRSRSRSRPRSRSTSRGSTPCGSSGGWTRSSRCASRWRWRAASSRRETAPNRALYHIARGTVMLGGRVLTRGSAWGDDVILTNAALFVPFKARAISYVDVAQLKREALLSVVEAHPKDAKDLRRSGVFLALRRYIINVAKRARGGSLKANPSVKAEILFNGTLKILNADQEGGHRVEGDFMDRMYQAAEHLLSQEQEESMKLALALERPPGEEPATPTPPAAPTATPAPAGSFSPDKGARRPHGKLEPLTEGVGGGTGEVGAGALREVNGSLAELKRMLARLQEDVNALQQGQQQQQQ